MSTSETPPTLTLEAIDRLMSDYQRVEQHGVMVISAEYYDALDRMLSVRCTPREERPWVAMNHHALTVRKGRG